jgi:hypothetical protein
MAADEARLSITLTADQRDQLRLLAAQNRTSVGLVVRAMVDHGLDHLTKSLQRAIDDEVETDRLRRVETGRAVMARRWHGTSRTKGTKT